jgi:lipoprotein-anchoring transpeptidase ErfK/SrfK
MQPRLLHSGDPNRPNANIPPGPNNAVGVMWMALLKPHYGIHGTAEPQTIGYAVSSGCVRLTNWDARFLAARTEPGTSVRFRDIPPGRQEGHATPGA